MADNPPNPDPRLTNRPAAAIVGGIRRRGRRPPAGVPRASAAPTASDNLVSGDSVSPVSATTTAASAYGSYQQSPVATRDPRHDPCYLDAPPRLPSMNFYPPLSGIPADYRPSTAPGSPAGASVSSDSLVTPTSMAPTSSAEGKKKHGMFSSFKGHGHDRLCATQAMLTPSSPLPPTTPKAARMLGLPEGLVTVHEPIASLRDDESDDRSEPGMVRSRLKKQASMPTLTKFKEHDIEPDLPKDKKFSWGKAAKMWDTLTTSKKTKSPSLVQQSGKATASPPLLYQYKEATDDVFSNEPIPTESPPSAPEASSRRSRKNKKSRKELEKMSPIVETSHDELRSAYQHSASVPDLGVVPEYRGLDRPLPPMPPMPRFQGHHLGQQLERHDVYPTGSPIESPTGIGGSSTHRRPGVPMSSTPVSRRPIVSSRGPLQTFENQCLDLTEENLEVFKKKVAEWEATKQQTDAEVRALKASHDEMKKKFEKLTARDEKEEKKEEEDDDDDLVSIRSSIDLDEEPTVHTAVAMPILRVTPGMVKLVDIPPRKK